jgi:hypothetical protein
MDAQTETRDLSKQLILAAQVILSLARCTDADVSNPFDSTKLVPNR